MDGDAMNDDMVESDATRPAPVKDAEVTILEDEFGLALRLAQIAVFKDLIATFKACDLRPAEFTVLRRIAANPGLKQESLGESLRIQRPNVVTIIDQLEHRGLVQRGAVPGDRRSYALVLTAKGRKLLAEAEIAHAAYIRREHALIGPDILPILVAALKRIANI
jgi:DNA-binding MarR family transcriptional regulator